MIIDKILEELPTQLIVQVICGLVAFIAGYIVRGVKVKLEEKRRFKKGFQAALEIVFEVEEDFPNLPDRKRGSERFQEAVRRYIARTGERDIDAASQLITLAFQTSVYCHNS